MQTKMDLSEIVDQAYTTAIKKGFWELPPLMVPQKLALIHAEVSEALEAYRNNQPLNEVGEELADIIIRVADLAGALHVDLDQAVQDKMKKNKERPIRHGKSF